jgi:hypothetical protein
MKNHVTLVGAIQIGFGALGVITALVVFVVLVTGGLISQDQVAMAVTTGVGTAVGLLVLIFNLPAVIGGIGLLKYRPWARILVMIVSVVDLLCIPLGTVLGVYSLWVLMQEETIALFREGGTGGPSTTPGNLS